MDNINDLLERRQKIYDVDLTDEHWEKLKGADTVGGHKVTVIWKDWGKNYPDEGYLFALDFCAEDEADVFCHFRQPQNTDGVDTAPPVWMHMYELMTNDNVESITVRA